MTTKAFMMLAIKKALSATCSKQIKVKSSALMDS